jgi:hypothetical protein
MQTEKANPPEIIYDEVGTLFLNELIIILLEENYFSFLESALEYVSEMKSFIQQNIYLLLHHPAPKYFSKYKTDMEYIAYQANKRTTWYIFFKQLENRFIVYYITNNHFEGQYIR